MTEAAAERPRAYTYGPMPYTEDWYAMRRDKTNPRFGASQAAALLGISQYATKRHVYESYFTDKEDEPNDSMITGTVMEPAIQELYVRFKGAGLVRGIPTLLHKTEPLLATLDSRKVGGSGHWNFCMDGVSSARLSMATRTCPSPSKSSTACLRQSHSSLAMKTRTGFPMSGSASASNRLMLLNAKRRKSPALSSAN